MSKEVKFEEVIENVKKDKNVSVFATKRKKTRSYSEELMRVTKWMLSTEPGDRPDVEDLLNLPHVSMRLRERALKRNLQHTKRKEDEVRRQEEKLQNKKATIQKKERELEEREEQIE